MDPCNQLPREIAQGTLLKTLAKRDMKRHVTGDVTRYLF